MKTIFILTATLSILLCNTARAQVYSTESNGDAVIHPGGVYCVVGGYMRVEKGRAGQAADIVLTAGRGCSSSHTGDILLQNDTFISGRLQVNSNIYVKSKIYAKSVEITQSVPSADYVFQEDYSLLPLSAVEKYIDQNKHLPNVPSAAEFKQNGYDIGKMDNVLLEKVEELTLHIIRQEKHISQQEDRLKILEEKLND